MDYNNISHKWLIFEKEGKKMNENSFNNDQTYRLKQFFVNKSEKLIAILGNTYMQNYFANGTITKGFSFISDKRVYFKGQSFNVYYNNNGKPKVAKSKRSQVVDLKDVTGTEIKSISNMEFIFYAIMDAIAWVCFILYYYLKFESVPSDVAGYNFFFITLLVLFLYLYKKSQLSLISIQYAGGEIAFNIHWFSQNEIDDFQKMLRLAKDKVVDTTNTNNTITPKSSADELMKYGELLQKGLISPEEYEKIKRNLI